MKNCNSCKQTLSLESFAKNRSKEDGFSSTCRSCASIQRKKWYNSHKDTHKVSSKKNKRKYTDQLRAYKHNKPCTDCGVPYPYYVMEWDHLPGTTKEANLSRLLQTNSKKRFLEEIKKCELVCANCHKIRTYMRLISNPCEAVKV